MLKYIIALSLLLASAGATAQSVKVSALPPASTLSGTEKMAASQGSNCTTTGTPSCASVAITPSQLTTYMALSFQPIDADLSAIAALSTQSFGRNLLTTTDAVAARSSLGLGALATLSSPLAVSNGGTGDTGSAWTAYTPSLSCGTGSLTSATASGRYKQIGKTVFVQITISVTTNGTCGTYVISSVPVTSAAATTNTFWTLTGRERAVTRNMLQGEVFNGSNTVVIFNYNNSFASADGALLNLTGVYEAG